MALVALGLAATACHHDKDALLFMNVTAAGSPKTVVTLEVTLNGPAGPSMPVRFARDDGQPLTFPTTLTAVIPTRATGDNITVDIRALGPAGDTVATGHQGPLTIHNGDRQTVFIELDCGGAPCVTDGGITAGTDGGAASGGPNCGNGRIDPGESCDTAIPPRDPGACPPADCSDGVACTRDVAAGEGCTRVCSHTEIRQPAPGDFCCPAGATIADDSDCSPTCGNGVVDALETCDVALPPGLPGACPSSADCLTGNPCLDDRLVSTGTCSATCVHYPVGARSDVQDGCCPPGATKGGDLDCPIVCGNGIQEAGEACDPGIAAPDRGACPTTCPPPGTLPDACNPSVLVGAGCQASCVSFPVTAPISGDGCCPIKNKDSKSRYTHAEDTDCPVTCGDQDVDCQATCGNGVLEPGEACDKAAPPPFGCLSVCPPPPSACLRSTRVGSVDDCSARCVISQVTGCSGIKDGCCPEGCAADTDPDCSSTCGDGFLQRTNGEVCDTAAAPGTKPGSVDGRCPRSCASADPCTEAILVSAGTCSATCVLVPVTVPRPGDGCCLYPDASVDPDCAPFCGNGVVEAPEHCDRGIEDSCPTTCQAVGCNTVELRAAGTCSASCVSTPITACVSGDGCCPSGCTVAYDEDCPSVCGDGVREHNETCDRAITAGAPGACPRTCDDGDACTADVAGGSLEACTRTCNHVTITSCLGGDGCCPPGCSATADSDCAPTCGDGRIGAGETCDPPNTCPTTCPDDGDPCTHERLDGDPRACTAACRHDPITACSGSRSDSCCPTGCTNATDTDC